MIHLTLLYMRNYGGETGKFISLSGMACSSPIRPNYASKRRFHIETCGPLTRLWPFDHISLYAYVLLNHKYKNKDHILISHFISFMLLFMSLISI